MTARFEGLTVLLTGATGGFGRSAAAAFAAEGAKLVLSDHPSAPLDAMAAEFEGAAALAGDVTDPGLHRDLVALALERFGSLDVAVNNAGVAHRRGFLTEIEDDDARRCIEVDLLGVFFAMKAQIPVMSAQAKATGRSCAIVNLASVAGVSGAPTISVYAAAKHGVVGLTRSASAECARRGVRINAVCPAYARTPMVVNGLLEASDDGEAEAALVRGVPMRRLADPEEIIPSILFAADPANSFMTGQTIVPDGGITAV